MVRERGSAEPMTRPDRVRRSVLVTACMLVVAAVTIVILRSWLARETELAEPPGGAAIAADAEPIGTQQELVDVAPATVLAEPEATGIVPDAVAPPAQKLIVLPARAESDDPLALPFVNAVRHAMLRELGTAGKFDIVDVSPAELPGVLPVNAGTIYDDRLAYLAIANRFGGEYVVEISQQESGSGLTSPTWMIYARTRTHTGGGSRGTNVLGANDGRPGKDADSIGADLAVIVGQRGPTPTLPTDADAPGLGVLLDTMRADDERLQALSRIRGGGFSTDVVNAAIELATNAESADTRRLAWGTLRRNLFEPALAQPLATALLYDPDERVRREAALALAAYVGDGVTTSSLEYAIDNDTSADVRLAARMSTMTYDEQEAFKRKTLLDSSLTPAERLAPMSMSSTAPSPTFLLYDDELTRAYAEIVADTDDAEIKLRAFSSLRIALLTNEDPYMLEVLLDSFEHEDQRVRTAALRGLRNRTDDPKVRELLETVLEEEPELAAEADVASALAAADDRP